MSHFPEETNLWHFVVVDIRLTIVLYNLFYRKLTITANFARPWCWLWRILQILAEQLPWREPVQIWFLEDLWISRALCDRIPNLVFRHIVRSLQRAQPPRETLFLTRHAISPPFVWEDRLRDEPKESLLRKLQYVHVLETSAQNLG